MNKVYLSSIFLLSLSFAGCGLTTDIGAYETGVYVNEEKMKGFTKGNSTQDDIIRFVGHPVRKEQLNEKEVWYYDYTKIRHFGGNVSESTVFEFNSKGVLLQAYKTGNVGPSGNPLLDAAQKNKK